MHGYFQLSQHADTGRGNYCNHIMGQEPSFKQTYEDWKSNIFLVHSVCSRLIER